MSQRTEFISTDHKEVTMKGRKPSYVVSTVTSTENGDRWREIGVAFENDKRDTITVLLDALPVSGKLVLRAPKAQASETR
jgi:hypothetical protein